MIAKGRDGYEWPGSNWLLVYYPLIRLQWNICMFPPRALYLLAGQDIQVTADSGSCRRRLDDVIHKSWWSTEKEADHLHPQITPPPNLCSAWAPSLGPTVSRTQVTIRGHGPCEPSPAFWEQPCSSGRAPTFARGKKRKSDPLPAKMKSTGNKN